MSAWIAAGWCRPRRLNFPNNLRLKIFFFKSKNNTQFSKTFKSDVGQTQNIKKRFPIQWLVSPLVKLSDGKTLLPFIGTFNTEAGCLFIYVLLTRIRLTCNIISTKVIFRPLVRSRPLPTHYHATADKGTAGKRPGRFRKMN